MSKKNVKVKVFFSLLVTFCIGLSLVSATYAADEVGIDVRPGAILDHEGIQYVIVGDAENLIGNGEFEWNPNIWLGDSRAVDRMIMKTGSYEWSTSAAHTGEHGILINSNTNFVYRTYLEEGKKYVFSAWFKVPSSASFNSNYIAIKESGSTVGSIEIGNTVNKTGDWQQVDFIFTARGTGLFTLNFMTQGTGRISMDDLALYELVEFDADSPDFITFSTPTQKIDDRNVLLSRGFNTGGHFVQNVTVTNNHPMSYTMQGVIALYKDNRLVSIGVTEEFTLEPFESEEDVQLEIDIPTEEEDYSVYKVRTFFIDSFAGMNIYGRATSSYPFVVNGR